MPQLWPRKAKAKNKKTSVNLDNRVNSQHMERKPVESWWFVIYSAASNLEGEKKVLFTLTSISGGQDAGRGPVTVSRVSPQGLRWEAPQRSLNKGHA